MIVCSCCNECYVTLIDENDGCEKYEGTLESAKKFKARSITQVRQLLWDQCIEVHNYDTSYIGKFSTSFSWSYTLRDHRYGKG